jgi:hypothetical protein
MPRADLLALAGAREDEHDALLVGLAKWEVALVAESA